VSVRLWSLAGNRQKLDGGAMFGNAPRAMWAKWVAVESDNRIDLACRALLAEGLNGKRVLFETGIGAFFDPKLRERYGVTEDRHVLLDSLAAFGLSDADIDVVVLSHLHFDHAGGLLAAWQPDGRHGNPTVCQGCYSRTRRSWSVVVVSSAPARRMRVIVRRSSPSCPRCCATAEGWSWWIQRSLPRWVKRCISTSVMVIRRA